MALFENFPYTNLHELNLDWIVQQLNMIKESVVISVNGQTGDVILYQNATVQFPDVAESDWSIIRMADGTTRGIIFKDDNSAYIVHGNQLSRIYSDDNPPAYPVTSVNGKTGAVVLYDEQYVMLPTLTDAQMNNWTFFRTLNSVARGIQFDDNGSAYIIDGVNRYMLYSTNNVPPYPVTSVNGQTGTVILFTDSNGDVRFPNFTDPNYEGWSVERQVNGTMIGLVFADDGTITLKVGLNEYKVYTENDPQEGFVSDPTQKVMEVTENSTDNYWGLLRTTTEGQIGIMFSNADPDDPEVFLAYVDSNDQGQTVQLLTSNDIPAGAGVITVNSKYGVVTLYGSDLDISLTDTRTISQGFEDTKTLIAYVENSNIAVNYIPINSFVIWKNDLYISTANIITNDVLSSSNLTQASIGGIANLLKTDINTVTSLINSLSTDFRAGSTTNVSSIVNIETLLANTVATMNPYSVKNIVFSCGATFTPFDHGGTWIATVFKAANNALLSAICSSYNADGIIKFRYTTADGWTVEKVTLTTV